MSGLDQQIAFLVESDRLNTVLRRNYTVAADRRENSAEHSWHVALTAMLLAEYSNQPVNIDRVVRMLLVHDLVEIDAGDTFIYDSVANISRKPANEKQQSGYSDCYLNRKLVNCMNSGTNLKPGQRRKQSSPEQSTDSWLFSTITLPVGAAGKKTESHVQGFLK